MTARTDVPRSLPDRQHLGAQLREARDAVGLTQRDVAAMTGIRQCSVSYVERAARDVLLSSAVDLAAAAGRRLAVVAEYHLPLLGLTADELDALVRAAGGTADRFAEEAIRDGDGDEDIDPALLSALDKLTTTAEEAS